MFYFLNNIIFLCFYKIFHSIYLLDLSFINSKMFINFCSSITLGHFCLKISHTPRALGRNSIGNLFCNATQRSVLKIDKSRLDSPLKYLPNSIYQIRIIFENFSTSTSPYRISFR